MTMSSVSCNYRHALYWVFIWLLVITIYISLSLSHTFVTFKYLPKNVQISQTQNHGEMFSRDFQFIFPDQISGKSSSERPSERTLDYLIWKINNLFPPDNSYLFLEEQNSDSSLEDRRTRRMELLEAFCASEEYRNRKLGNYAETTDRLDVSLVKDFTTFECRTPKTGNLRNRVPGTTARGAIMWGLFHEGPVKKKHPNGDPKIPSMRIQDFLNKKQNNSEFSSWFGFHFVRDPFDRAISAYFDKVREGNRLTGRSTNLTSYFEQLVSGKVSNDPHFLPQLAVCDPCRLNTSFYGRTETLSTDMDYVINYATAMHRKLNYTSQISVERKFLNNKTDDSRLSNMTLDEHVFYQFLWKYRHDFLAYGYSPHEAIKKFNNLIKS